MSPQATASSWSDGGHQASGPTDCTRKGFKGSGSTFFRRNFVRSLEREISDICDDRFFGFWGGILDNSALKGRKNNYYFSKCQNVHFDF